MGPGKDKRLTLKVFDCRDNSLRETNMVLSIPESLHCSLSWAQDGKSIYAIIKTEYETQIIDVNTETGKVLRTLPISRKPQKLGVCYSKKYASYLADGTVYTINFENLEERNITADMATQLGTSTGEITCYSFNWLPERYKLAIAFGTKGEDHLIIYDVKNNSVETQLGLNSLLLADNMKPELIGAIQQTMPLNTEKMLVLANLIGTSARTKTYRTKVSPPMFGTTSAEIARYQDFSRSASGWGDVLSAATLDAIQQSAMTKEIETQYVESSTDTVPAIFVVDTVQKTMVPLRQLLQGFGQIRIK